MENSSSFKRMYRAFGFIRPVRISVFIIIGFTFTLAGLNAVEPLVLKYLFDKVGGGGDATRSLVFGVAGLAMLALLRESAGGISNWLTWRTRLSLHYTLLSSTVARLQELPMSYHRAESVGGIMTRLDRGIQGFLGAVCDIAFNVLPALLYLAVSLVIMVRLDWRLALVVTFFTPLPALITVLAAPEHIRRERTLLERWTRIYARFNEVLTGILTVKSFAMERQEIGRFLNDVDATNRIVVKGVRRDSKIGAAQNLVIVIARIAAIAVGGLLVVRGEITIGTLIAFLGYVGGLFGPVQGLSSIYRTLRTASVSLEAIFSILDAPDELEDAPDAREVRIEGAVHFDRVVFSYHPDRKPVLDGIDLKVRHGEMVALVGPSGTGKSTMMALLQRLYDPIQGCIRVDGVDLRSITQCCLRRQIGIVLQDTLLFNDTVQGNIAYGKPEASLTEVARAARYANAHHFILRLPEGYKTVVGERGGRLSAGERQRIAIARAILKDPPILILDEATSALDAETEALIQEALGRLMKGRTTFMIAHRLSTVIAADRILVLKDGRIIEQGSHSSLMEAKGYYASLVRKQNAFLLPDISQNLTGFRLSPERRNKVVGSLAPASHRVRKLPF